MRVALNRDHAAALSVIAGAWGTVTAAAGPLSVRWDQLARAVGLPGGRTGASGRRRRVGSGH
jgi:hypothetical protein